MRKQYDRRYFDHWYRSGDARGRKILLQRKVALAVAMTEYYLGRPLRRILDVGCGEGAWRAPLLALRPHAQYRGVDASTYAIARHGVRRNLHLVRFAELEHLRFDAAADLLVCSDVLHYLGADEMRRGLAGFRELCGGLAWIEVFCRGDAIDGDRDQFVQRSPAAYRRAFAAAGLIPCGSHGYLTPALASQAVALETFAADT